MEIAVNDQKPSLLTSMVIISLSLSHTHTIKIYNMEAVYNEYRQNLSPRLAESVMHSQARATVGALYHVTFKSLLQSAYP